MGHRDILDLDLTLPAEKVHEVADVAVAHANAAVSELRRLFLVEDFVDSLKFSVLLWCLTYVGSWFNGMTLIIIGILSRCIFLQTYFGHGMVNSTDLFINFRRGCSFHAA